MGGIILGGESPAVAGAAGGDLDGNFPNPVIRAWRTLIRGTTRGQASVITAGGVYVLSTGGGAVQALNAPGATMAAIPLNPADWAADGYETMLRFKVGCLVTDTAPAVTFTFGLYPVTAWAGGTTVSTPTLGPVIADSVFSFATPAANSINAEKEAIFDFPAQGYYLAAVDISGVPAPNSNPNFPWRLQVKNVAA